MSPEVGLTDVLARQTEDERERALRALLMCPLIGGGSEEHALIRRHSGYLRDWLARETGWRLHVERSFARLFKTPADTGDATRGQPYFDRERYAVLCLVCAVLERGESQITLQRLGEQLLETAQDPELAARGFAFTLESHHHRRALVQVCRFLLEHGVLSRVVGDEETYINRSGDVLYDVNRRVLATLPASTRGASLIAANPGRQGLSEVLSALVEEYVPDTAEGRRMALRHRLSRGLLDDPVLYHDELTEEERQYLASQRGPMAARLAEATGLAAELRAEGLALVDEQGELSDRQLPAVGTLAHATLLLAEHLAQAARDEPQRLHSLHELAAFIRTAADRYGRFWRKDARAPGAEAELAAQAVDCLEALRLVQRVRGSVWGRPTLLRYAVREARQLERAEA
ncbi:MAG: TIGR02678 family protein [Steroidobacteraceae bacterium]